MWAWTSVTPQVGRSYYLYNMGTNSYWYGTKSTYTTTANIADAIPLTVESGYKLAFVFEGTTYRIYHYNGTKYTDNTEGVNFTFEGSATSQWGYQLKSKHNDHDRWMCPDGTFQQSGKYYNRDWKFCSVYEVNSGTAAECASTAEASYLSAANGWERVTDNATLEASLSDYFFAIVCANYPGIMVNMADGNASQQASGYSGSKSMWYSNLANPKNDNSFLWMIEKCNESGFEGYTFRNASYPTWTVQAESSHSEYAHTHDQANPCKWSSYELAQTNGVYTIKTLANGGTNYLGLWTPSNDYANGQELAGNKSAAEQGKFLIYRIPKYKLDMTSRISNPSFETDDDGHFGATGWTLEEGASNDTKVHLNSNATYTMTKVDGAKLFNTWNGDNRGYYISQTLNNIPAGVYKLTAVMAAHEGQTLQLIANDETGEAASVNKETGVNMTTYVTLASPGDLEIKAKTAANAFYKVDNFRLTYIASSLTEDLTTVSGKMNADVNTAQQNAVTTYNSNKTAANYIAAKDAIAAAEASVEAYANALTYLNKVEELLATTNFYTSTAYDNVYGNYKTAYDNGTMEDATAAGLTYKVASHTPSTQRYTDNTANDLLIPGWTIGGNDAAEGEYGFYINTWSNEDGSTFANPFYEYWVGSGSLAATTLTGTKTGLTPNRLYRVTANVRIQGTANSGKIKMQVGTGDEIDVTKGNQIGETTRYMNEYIAVGMTDADGKLTLKFNVESENNISWLSFRDIMYAEQDDNFTYLIKNADCTSNDNWPTGETAGRTFGKANDTSNPDVTDWTETTRNVFSNNTSGGSYNRKQDVTFPVAGWYRLDVLGLVEATTGSYGAKVVNSSSETLVEEKQDYSQSLKHYILNADGTESSTLKTDGTGWTKQELYFNVPNANDVETIYLWVSDGSQDHTNYAFIGGLKLTYLGDATATMQVSKVAKAGTFCAPFDVEIPDGVTAYTTSAVEDATLKLTPVETTIPAGTPVILQLDDEYEETINQVFYGATTAASPSTAYLLKGTYDITDITSGGGNTYYIMQYANNKASFYAVPNDATRRVGANRCYLALPTGTVIGARIDIGGDDETAINVIEAAEAESEGLKDGKYLENGQIIIVKNGVKYSTNGQILK